MSDRQLSEPTDSDLIETYIKLDDKLDIMTKAFEAQIAPYKQGMNAITSMLHDRLNKRGAKNTATEFGTAFKKDSTSFRVPDKQAFIRFCLSDPDWGMNLLTSHIAKEGAEAFMEKHENQLPPGVTVEFFTKVHIRRK